MRTPTDCCRSYQRAELLPWSPFGPITATHHPLDLGQTLKLLFRQIVILCILQASFAQKRGPPPNNRSEGSAPLFVPMIREGVLWQFGLRMRCFALLLT